MNEFIKAHQALFERDLNNLKKEISLYEKDEDLWKVSGDVKNSGGNLALHLIGNLRHFFGHVLNGTDYIRNRDAEFNSKNIDRQVISEDIDLTISEVKESLRNLTEEQLNAIFPIQVLGYEMTTAYFIIHLYGHLNYHLGQVNYHRRIMIED